MTDTSCAYSDEREEMLVSFLYDDIDPGERAAFQSHLLTCVRCRDEVAGFKRVRTQLSHWAPPEPTRVLADRQTGAADRDARPAGARVWSALAAVPAWTQVAAALMVLGVSAGVANLDVHYDQNGLSVHTGWSKPVPAPAPVAAAAAAPARARRCRGSNSSPGRVPRRTGVARADGPRAGDPHRSPVPTRDRPARARDDRQRAAPAAQLAPAWAT